MDAARARLAPRLGPVALALHLALAWGCYMHTPFDDGADGDGDTDVDSDADSDADSDSDSDSDLCVPDCAGRECGADGCGGSCAPGCPTGEVCDPAVGLCVEVTPGDLLAIPPGTFMMGSPESEEGRYDGMGALDLETLHEVTLTRGFVLGHYEVTQEEFEDLLGYNPSTRRLCPDCPVETISWHEAAAYTNALSDAEGLARCYDCTGSGPEVSCRMSSSYASPYVCSGYRLPTEAEWEYAARAGTTAATWVGDLHYSGPVHFEICDDETHRLEPIAWYCRNAEAPQPVGTRAPNPWGLYDMLGNVFEWCHDHGNYDNTGEPAVDPFGPSGASGHVYRGGSWFFAARYARAAARMFGREGTREHHLGFRVARTAP